MNKKGFTLVELLATIVIIALIMTIVMPSASKVSQNNKIKIYKEYEKMMVEYARVSELNEQNTINLFDLEGLDKVKNDCFGYVQINHSVTPVAYSASISCGNEYTTTGYNSTLADVSNVICRGCKFIYITSNTYTTWNTSSSTPTALTSGLYSDYQSVVSSSGKDYFLGVVLNSSNQVTRAYACGVKNSVPFCIEGSSNNSKYNSNKILLESGKLWNNGCDITTSSSTESIHCGITPGALDAKADTTGVAIVGVVDQGYCRVWSNGNLKCMTGSH